MSTLTAKADPVSQSERITALDSIRGIAILGILLMNIPYFALPHTVGYDPSIRGETGINYYLWYIVTWLFDGTQRALFSMLFGAGIILFVSRQEKRTTGLEPADYFFRRQLWLIAISTFDVYVLLWPGDILLDYACFGMLLFTFRKLSPRTLIIAATVCLVCMLMRENRDLYKDKAIIWRGKAVAAIDTTQTKLTKLQKKQLEDMNAFKKRSTMESKLERTEEINQKVQGNYGSVYEYRTDNYINHITYFIYLQAWDVLIFFLLGMAFFKLGILTGDAPVKLYAWMAVIGLSIGLALSYMRVHAVIAHNFNWFEHTREVPLHYYQLDRIFRSVGLLGAVMLLYKTGWFEWFFAMLRPVGQMALTNYLAQSLICCIIFNGFALGLFGKLARYEIYLVVASIWVFQFIFCNIWMRFFLYGPAEWAWRSLTYWRRQPFRKPATLVSNGA